MSEIFLQIIYLNSYFYFKQQKENFKQTESVMQHLRAMPLQFIN